MSYSWCSCYYYRVRDLIKCEYKCKGLHFDLQSVAVLLKPCIFRKWTKYENKSQNMDTQGERVVHAACKCVDLIFS